MATQKIIRRLRGGAFAACLAIAMAAPGAPRAEFDGERKINLAGRQEMITQYLAKAICFATLDINRGYHFNQIAHSHWLFEATQTELRDGDSLQGIQPEQDPKVLARLLTVDELWIRYGALIEAWREDGARDTATVQSLYALSGEILVDAYWVVTALENAFISAGRAQPGLTSALRLSSRQRMLIQKMSKELCFVASGYDLKNTRAALARSVWMFERSLDILTKGNEDSGVPAPPVGVIVDQLASIREKWTTLSAIFKRAELSGEPSPEELREVAAASETLLFEINKVVWLYEELISAQ